MEGNSIALNNFKANHDSGFIIADYTSSTILQLNPSLQYAATKTATVAVAFFVFWAASWTVNQQQRVSCYE